MDRRNFLCGMGGVAAAPLWLDAAGMAVFCVLGAEAARLLLEEKTEVARMERQSRRRHLARLGAGLASFETSDLHLETVRALKDFNSLIAAVAYPPLYRGGQLLETRLIGSLGAAAG